MTLVCLVFLKLMVSGWSCTSIVFGPKATEDGYPITSHSNDCNTCDNRIAYVKRREDLPESKPIFDATNTYYPRVLHPERSSVYSLTEDYPSSFDPLGHVEVPALQYALWESSYPLMNEYGLAIGESTTGGRKIIANNVSGSIDPNTGTKGGSLLLISQLMELALEQCKDVKCAIETMGRYGEKYGFAGESFGESEATTIVDSNEAWVFEIQGDGNNGAIWVAQRVPEGHVAVVSNTCIIKEILSTEDFKYSKNIHEVAEKFGLWSARDGRALNWQRDICSPIDLPRYSSLRTWRIFSRVSAEQHIRNEENPFHLPFSAPVDRPVNLRTIFSLFGDHYEGTEFDMTQGSLAGISGDPNYEMAGPDLESVEGGGQIPRAISLHRTSYVMIASTKQPFPVVWYAVDAPATSVWVPFYASALATGSYSNRYGTETAPQLQKFDRYTAFWAFDFVANFMGLNYANMSEQMVFPKREALQNWVMQQAIEAETRAVVNKEEAQEILGRAQTAIQDHVASSWWEFADELIVRYNDGYYNFPEGKHKYVGQSHSLPKNPQWLRMLGFSKDFYRPTAHWIQPASRAAFEEASASFKALEVPGFFRHSYTEYAISIFAILVSLLIGYFGGKSSERKQVNIEKKVIQEGGYAPI